jgi:hypothetical protein
VCVCVCVCVCNVSIHTFHPHGVGVSPMVLRVPLEGDQLQISYPMQGWFCCLPLQACSFYFPALHWGCPCGLAYFLWVHVMQGGGRGMRTGSFNPWPPWPRSLQLVMSPSLGAAQPSLVFPSQAGTSPRVLSHPTGFIIYCQSYARILSIRFLNAPNWSVPCFMLEPLWIQICIWFTEIEDCWFLGQQRKKGTNPTQRKHCNLNTSSKLPSGRSVFVQPGML